MGDIKNWNAQYWAFSTNNNNMKDATYTAKVMHKDSCALVTEGWVKRTTGAGSCGSLPTLFVCGGGWWTFEEVRKQLKYRYIYFSAMLGHSLKQCGRYEH